VERTIPEDKGRNRTETWVIPLCKQGSAPRGSTAISINNVRIGSGIDMMESIRLCAEMLAGRHRVGESVLVETPDDKSRRSTP
jgi:hypothetical protein